MGACECMCVRERLITVSWCSHHMKCVCCYCVRSVSVRMCEQSCDHNNPHRLEDPDHQTLFIPSLVLF